MTDRTPCVVPGCRRTVALKTLPPGDDEWICARHWAAVPKRKRRIYFRARRRLRRGEIERKRADWAWNRLKKIAIEEALLGLEI
ncbi:hypothetical protein [Maritimibacter sp. 55A14]|uniref:hypothetical protein n=1 Tax=Maritimibacter sp. 55A14 TaxID=2174844 RepID=UPI0011B1E9E7|nr:hypothetical protein [Maritimibacter sp. 55A14]